jgi:hypothetical protein
VKQNALISHVQRVFQEQDLNECCDEPLAAGDTSNNSATPHPTILN